MWRMSDPHPALAQEAQRLLAEYLDKIEHCLGLLSDEQLWWRPNARCNTVANLVLHLCGNLSQWVLAGLGGVPFERRRREEFAAVKGDGAAVLLGRLSEVVAACRTVLDKLSDENLARTFVIQGYTGTGLGVLLHAVEHMSYHTGQIVFITKQLIGERAEVEFYPHLR